MKWFLCQCLHSDACLGHVQPEAELQIDVAEWYSVCQILQNTYDYIYD